MTKVVRVDEKQSRNLGWSILVYWYRKLEFIHYNILIHCVWIPNHMLGSNDDSWTAQKLYLKRQHSHEWRSDRDPSLARVSINLYVHKRWSWFTSDYIANAISTTCLADTSPLVDSEGEGKVPLSHILHEFLSMIEINSTIKKTVRPATLSWAANNVLFIS